LKARAFALGLGGNLGDVVGTMTVSVKVLEDDPRISSLSVSSFYITSPWGDVSGGDFLNAAVSGLWKGSDISLLMLCRQLELSAGSPVEKNGQARSLDVDLLFIQEGSSSADLVLPHPRMAERKFVLVPLAEVWSGEVPGLGKTPEELLEHVIDSSSIIFGGDLRTC
jgi:2-amino-4-hydroxy-6-hydroxymethyldihydropteridine diphosphokinase